ncbi:NAD-dependent epimerase/dehydratase family protein [Puia dinghuensis]|uniref:NAD-dependent dehydratase n=1 Tax=Puia dinghuensis TaxID=1792502 RepID=A0A8J2UDT8_9BACT|nr:NAD-dependent epimerase/dehydratase family protein [Puia dinghuensis]GGB02352.1 NAD-dependent dehydratase [Puia dinghuensis]
MQTILGANGQIGIELAKELHQRYTKSIRLVSRHPRKVNESDELFAADLLDAGQTMQAVAGSQIVYLTVGIPMDTKVWEDQWPKMMSNVIDACKAHNARLVYFDNTYMLPQTAEVQTEETRFRPNGPKGRVKAKVASMLLDEMQKGGLEAIICRAPEFYGPGKTQSITNSLVFNSIRKGKKPRVLLRDDTLRTLIYTPDASKAMALIANSNDTFQQTWHLPCDDDRLTYKELIRLTGEVLGEQLSYSILSSLLLKVSGLFNPRVREIAELLPRYRSNNLFDSQKFKRRFPDFPITGYKSGIKAIVSAWEGKAPG